MARILPNHWELRDELITALAPADRNTLRAIDNYLRYAAAVKGFQPTAANLGRFAYAHREYSRALAALTSILNERLQCQAIAA
jgi:hypothetical protein